MWQEHEARIGRFAWVMAWVGLVVGQLHALARFRTPEGRSDVDPIEYPWVAAWAVPADDRLSPLLDWGSAGLVYVHYGKVWFPVFLAFTLCALAVYRRRQAHGFERWAWRAAVTSYSAATLGVFLSYWTQWTGDYDGAGLEATLFSASTWIMFPSMLLMLLTTTILGVTLLAERTRPVFPAALLASVVPAGLVITQVTSLGSVAVPVMFAFGILGRRVARAEDTRTLPRPVAA